MTAAPNFMALYGARLVDNGYPVIPIMPGSKVPGRHHGGQWTPYPDWARHCDRITKPFEVDIWQRWPGCGIGIAAGAVVGIDIDILDPALAIQLGDLATQMLGDTPCWRVGRAPKRMLVYRAATPFAGRKRHPLEVLARGQQFVAYAVHPDTGQPYAWPEANLLDVPLDRLPVVEEAACHAFLDAAWRLIPDDLRINSILAEAPSSEWHGPSDPKGTREAIAAALAWLPNDDLPGNEWITVGAAIKAALGEEGRELWLDWSRQSPKSGQSGRSDTPERRWASLRPHSVGAGTIYWLAEQRGWVPDPALTLNGTIAAQMAQPHPAAALLAKAEATPMPRAPEPKPYRVPPELLQVDGVLGQFVAYATASAVSPQPLLALGAAICLVGALAGRRYRTPTDLRSNVYAIGIADSGGGKDHARRCVKRALYAAGLDRYLGGEDLASSAGLLTSLQRHPARLFQVDEFGQFLKLVLSQRAPAHKAAIWSELTKLYTSAAEPYIGAEYADQKARPRVTIEQPCACIWGVTVPGPFWSALEGGALADGSIARFLVFLTDDDYPERNETPAPMDPPPALVSALQAIARGVPGHSHGGNIADAMEASAPIHAYTVPVSPDAEAAMARVRREATDLLRSHRGTYATALFGRYAENTAKLAMIAAVSRDPARPVTEAGDVAWASLLVEHCVATMLREAERRVSDNDTEAKHKRLLEIIRDGGRQSRSDVTRRSQFLTRREREEILASLVEAGLVVAEQEPGTTKPTTFYTAAAPTRPPLFTEGSQ
ncbi:PriCT-2 domain-containing protein [Falsiroseomonas ponticola]|uniref:PriCT-2 domain-containing protein n=1 Tax=Falsiroseomonas ponticola TaxID=2786951 RepID=UPI0019323F4D|nr:PriCT-2 domain-containing protein [Roseomonas ponticola]